MLTATALSRSSPPSAPTSPWSIAIPRELRPCRPSWSTRNGSRTIINRKAAGRTSLEAGTRTSTRRSPRVMLFDGHELDAVAASHRVVSQRPDDSRRRLSSRGHSQSIETSGLSGQFRAVCRQLIGSANLEAGENRLRWIAALHRRYCKAGRDHARRAGHALRHGRSNPAVSRFCRAGRRYHRGRRHLSRRVCVWCSHGPADRRNNEAGAAAAAAISVTMRGGRASIPELSASAGDAAT